MENPNDEQETDLANEPTEDKTGALTFLSIVLSTMAAAFGVQSSRNQERDFKKGNIWVYIISGITFTFLFVMAVSFVVGRVLENSGH